MSPMAVDQKSNYPIGMSIMVLLTLNRELV